MANKKRSGDPRKQRETVVINFTEKLNNASTYEEIVKVWRKVNKEIDRISDHPYKNMGEISSVEDLVYGFKKAGLTESWVIDNTKDNIDIYNALMMLPVGGNCCLSSPEGVVSYTRIR